MAIDLTTAGIKLGYGVETTAGTKPTAFTNIPGPKSIPDLNPEPETVESTTLNATEWKTYVDGLKDTGGALGITFNLTEAFMTTWESIMSAYETAKTDSKAMWFVVYIPGLTKGFFFTGNPSDLGLSAAEVGNILETTTYITPTAVKGWETTINPS